MVARTLVLQAFPCRTSLYYDFLLSRVFVSSPNMRASNGLLDLFPFSHETHLSEIRLACSALLSTFRSWSGEFFLLTLTLSLEMFTLSID